MLPCADCKAVRHELQLHADQSYSVRKTFEGGRNARVEDETGAWAYSSDRAVVVLKSTGGAWSWFAMPSPGVLRAVDVRGDSLGVRAPADLQRTEVAIAAVPSRPNTPAAESITLALSGAVWTLAELESRPVRPADKTHRAIAIEFDEDGQTFTGVSGCNEFTGSFEAGWRTLALSTSESLRVCRIDQSTERALARTIKATRTYRITGRTLDLFDERGTRIAKFEGAPIPSGR